MNYEKLFYDVQKEKQKLEDEDDLGRDNTEYKVDQYVLEHDLLRSMLNSLRVYFDKKGIEIR